MILLSESKNKQCSHEISLKLIEVTSQQLLIYTKIILFKRL
jgi:hypothetical protein